MKTAAAWRVGNHPGHYAPSSDPVSAWGRNLNLTCFVAALLLACSNTEVDGQTYSVLHSLNGNDGQWPMRTAVAQGVVYGVAAFGGSYEYGTVFRVQTNGLDFRVIKEFSGGDGHLPQGILVSGQRLYGVTLRGGSLNLGTLFSMDTNGQGYTVLRHFGDEQGGGSPSGGVVLSGDSLFGSTYGSGLGGDRGCIFRLKTNGSDFQLLHRFSGNDGANPQGELAISGDTLYGASPSGGLYNYGVVCKLGMDGSDYAVLRHFNLDADGAEPVGPLLLLGDTLYGTTSAGGIDNNGTIFSLKTDGSEFRVLKRFTGPEGANPAPPLACSGATLYGTGGGYVGWYGSIYKLNTDGSGFALLKSFGGIEGGYPRSGLVLYGGSLYGSVMEGGPGQGALFALSVPMPCLINCPLTQTAEQGSKVHLRAAFTGASPLSYQWFFNSNPVAGETQVALRFPGIQPSQAGVYSVVISNAFGAATSPPATLAVIPAVERRAVPGIELTGATGTWVNLVVADALTSPPGWVPFASVKMATRTQYYFDLTTPLPGQRYYWACQTNAAGPTIAMDLHAVPALTLTGGIGSAVRLDYIQQLGPVDAWVSLGSVRLTNSAQLYFDTSVVGQPPRLWRVVPGL